LSTALNIPASPWWLVWSLIAVVIASPALRMLAPPHHPFGVSRGPAAAGPALAARAVTASTAVAAARLVTDLMSELPRSTTTFLPLGADRYLSRFADATAPRAFYAMFGRQNAGVSSTRTVKTSRRPNIA
jgi:hypothetical protein